MTEKLFSVVEHFNHFAVRHNPTGQEHPMGDGVDHEFFDENNFAIPIGGEGFCEAWAESLNSNPGETLEAYFPHLTPEYLAEVAKDELIDDLLDDLDQVLRITQDCPLPTSERATCQQIAQKVREHRKKR